MAFSINNVRKILDTKLKTVTDLPRHVPENTKSAPGVDSWCRSTVMPATSSVAAWGAGVVLRQQGIYQVDLMFPAGSGVDTPSLVADRVVAAFYPGEETLGDEDTPITISNVTQMVGYLTTNQQYLIPIRVEWFTYVKNS